LEQPLPAQPDKSSDTDMHFNTLLNAKYNTTYAAWSLHCEPW